MSLCLAAAGLAVEIAASAFTLSWTHTVERIIWQEDWRIEAGGLVLDEAPSDLPVLDLGLPGVGPRLGLICLVQQLHELRGRKIGDGQEVALGHQDLNSAPVFSPSALMIRVRTTFASSSVRVLSGTRISRA